MDIRDYRKKLLELEFENIKYEIKDDSVYISALKNNKKAYIDFFYDKITVLDKTYNVVFSVFEDDEIIFCDTSLDVVSLIKLDDVINGRIRQHFD